MPQFAEHRTQADLCYVAVFLEFAFMRFRPRQLACERPEYSVLFAEVGLLAVELPRQVDIHFAQ